MILFRPLCLGSLLTKGLSCVLANEERLKGNCSKSEFKNKPCDWLKLAAYPGTCSRSNVDGTNNRTRVE